LYHEDGWSGLIEFCKDAKPDFRNAFVMNELERTLRVIETGRLCEKTPDYVGTWDDSSPYEGYFEMLIERDGGRFRGECVDCLGDADINGKMNGDEISFVKRYREGRCRVGACQGDVRYKGIIKDENVIGYYEHNGSGSPFIMRQEPMDLIDMSLMFSSLYEMNKDDIKERVVDQLFGR